MQQLTPQTPPTARAGPSSRWIQELNLVSHVLELLPAAPQGVRWQTAGSEAGQPGPNLAQVSQAAS